MSNNKYITHKCENCKGKGHVMDGVEMLVVTFNPFLWPIAAADSNSKSGLGRKECEHCGGVGYITIRIGD